MQLFGQDAYFRQPNVTPAAAPLPLLPPQGFNLPAQLLTHNDVWNLVSFCEKPVRTCRPLVESSR
jgi:hypothetical protein